MSVEQALATAGYTVESLLHERQRERDYGVRDASGKALLARVLDRQWGSDPDARAAFVEEGKLLAGFRHPQVLEVLASGEAAGEQYIILPRPERHLGELSGKPQPIRTVLAWMRDIATALDALHRHGVLHRDLRPAHLLLSGDRVVLAPIGIIRAQTTQRVSITSPRYMSPEQAEGDTGDGRSDLYSLGVVAWELICGHPPFPQEEEKEKEKK